MNIKLQWDDLKSLKVAAASCPGLSVVRLRQLCQEKKVICRQPSLRLWLISLSSLKKYLASDRKPGPKPVTS
jgi:hypothetical protein